MDLTGYDPACPDCGLPLPPPEVDIWGTADHPLTEAHILEGLLPGYVKAIRITCPNGHRFSAREHTWDLVKGRSFQGLARGWREYQPLDLAA